MFSNNGGYRAHNQVSEWCGELIDTQHHTIRNLAARYGLPLDDLHAAEPNKSDEIYKFGGQYYPKTQATNAELGRGHNGQLQFAQRGWLGTGPWPGKSNGATCSDTGYQATWEVTRAQPGTLGILVEYSGGNVTDGMRTASPFATATDPRVQDGAARKLAQLAPVYPGLAWNGKATQSLPHKSPFFNNSHSYWKVGQYTLFSGTRASRSAECTSAASTPPPTSRASWKAAPRPASRPPRISPSASSSAGRTTVRVAHRPM